MLCKSPYIIHGMACPCTKCMPCRFNRRRFWTNRIVLESMMHGDSSFLTLTYDDVHLPSGGTLVPRDVQLFLKRLRKAISPVSLRYYFVGEYGDQTQRPHYHAALFGIGIGYSDIVAKAWGRGHSYLGDLNLHSAQYIAGYVVKKMTAKDDPRLMGRYPEFARMSLRPGIGALAIPDIARSMISSDGEILGLVNGDVPNSLKLGGRALPLQRYLRRKLRVAIKMADSSTPKDVLDLYKAELQALYENSSNYEEGLSKKEYIVDTNKQKVLNFETRTKLYSSKGSL